MVYIVSRKKPACISLHIKINLCLFVNKDKSLIILDILIMKSNSHVDTTDYIVFEEQNTLIDYHYQHLMYIIYGIMFDS